MIPIIIEDIRWSGSFCEGNGTAYNCKSRTRPAYDEIYLTSWGGEMHLMTIVGYDDLVNCGSLGYGAFKVANSWDDDWGNEGFIWLPYELANDFLGLHIIEEVEYRQPQVIAKIKVKHNKRSMIRIGIHILDDPNGQIPGELSSYSKVFYAMDSEFHFG